MKHYLFAMRVALLLLLSFPLYVYADKKPSLRELFEGTNSSRMQIQAATDDVTVIDLEEWENEYDETLTIGNGKKYKFTNGELKWIGTSDSAPLIVVSNGSSIEIAEGATFSTNCCNDLIQMKGGEVILNGGKLYTICGTFHIQASNAKSSPATNMIPPPLPLLKVSKMAINMVSGNNYFRLNSGYIDGDIYSQAEQSSSFLLLKYGTIQHDVVAYKDIYIDRPEGQSSSWSIVLKDDAVAKIRKGGNELTFSVNDMQPGRVLAVGYDYYITESDLAKMHISGTNADNLKLSLENNQVVLRDKFSLSPQQTIHVSEPGTLPSLLTDASLDIVTELTVTGDLNADDLAFLEKMGKAKLEVLDISGANIVDGGEAYVGDSSLSDLCSSPEHPIPGIPHWPMYKIWEGTTKDVIPAFAFAGCDKLREVMLPNSVTSIEKGVLSSCQQLQNVTIGKNTTNIGYGLCYSCPELQSVKSESSDALIQNGIIYNADQSVILTSIGPLLRDEMSIPTSVKEISTAAFNSCTRLKLLRFTSSNDTIKIGSDAFAGSGLEKVYFYRPCEMSAGVFYHCSNLMRISLLGMRSLPQGCFEECPQLKELVIPEGVESVGRYACYNSGIETLTLPSTLKSLGNNCFAGNTKMKNIYSKAKTPPSISPGEGGVISIGDHTSFNSVDHDNCIVHVPSGSVHAYKLDLVRKQLDPGIVYIGWGNGWSDFKNIVCDKGNLKDLFDFDDPKASEEDPTNVTEGTDDIDVDDPNDGKPNLHVLFGDESNDIPEGTEPTKTLHFLFDGEYGMIVPQSSSYEFKNINIDLDNHNIKHVIYVDGTLIINVNVYFLNITEYVKHVIYIRKGGRVIFRGGRNYIPGVVIYNECGTIIYEGGDSRGGTHGLENLSGSVTVSGGTIGGYGYGINNTGGGTVTITGGHIYGGGTVDGGTPDGNTAGAGHVIYNDGNSRVNILGGEFDDNSSVWSEGSLWLNGSVNIRDFYIRNITVNIVSRITVDWYFYFIDGVDINNRIPLFKGDGYTLTEEDLSRIHIILPDGYRLVLDENNQIVIRSTNEICSENDLQAKINATVGNSSPDALTEIKIAETGIELTKTLIVPEGAYVNLVGGKLSVKKGYGNISHIVSIAENATLRMDNVTLDLYYVEKVCESMFLNNGHLIFGEGMKIDRDEYCSFKSAFIVNYGTFDMYSGSISGRYYDLGINGSTDRGTVNVYGGHVMYGITNSAVNLYGGSIVGGTVTSKTFVQKSGMAEVGINTDNCTIYDGSVYPLGELRATESAKLYGGKIIGGKIFARDMVIGDIDHYGMDFTFIPDGNDHSQNVITLMAPLKRTLKVTSDWENYDFSKKPVVCRGNVVTTEVYTEPLLGNVNRPIPEKLVYYYAKSVAAASASGYEVTQSDLDHITFVNLPEKVKASISNDNAIILSRKGSLKDLFTDLPEGGSEEEPNNVIPDDVDDVEVDKPDPGKPNLHLIFGDDNNDTPDGVKPVKSLQYFFDGEYGMTIHKTSSYEFKNINIDLGNHSIDHVFYVDGTLIIDVNVYFINITENVKHVIYIRKGGRVIFRGGKHYIPGVVIYNEGGTIIYEGGDSHGGTHGVENNGGTVTISGGTIGGYGYGINNTGGGTVTITGGHIYGGGTVDGGTPGGNTAGAGHVIYNDGDSRVNILGGDYDDDSSVWSEGSLWIDGSVNIRDFYIRRNITIYIVNHITIDWYFYFIDDVVIDCSIPLFKGEGYILTEEDLNRIHITLPDGYRLVLDKTKNAIFIVDDSSADSIGDATENSAQKSICSPSGMSLKATQKGLNIIDGKKVLIK